MEANIKLGELIKFIREKRLNLTQKELSEKLDVTVVYISYLEKAKRPPSKDLLKEIYALLDEDVPDETWQLLQEVKINKKKEKINVSPIDLIYDLKEKNLYKYPLMKKKLKEDPQNITLMYGIIRILIDEKKYDDAKRELLKFLSKVKEPQDKKWLEASYYELEGNTLLSIHLLEDYIKKFSHLGSQINSKISYQLASMYFRQGEMYYRENNKNLSINFFEKALSLHEQIRKDFEDPFYQMDYANIFLWLALLNVDAKNNFEKYLKNIKIALLLSHKKGIENSSFIEWRGLYNKPFIISSVSFMARAYANLAELERNSEKKMYLLDEGELLFSQHTPLSISSKYMEYYRFHFNQACFYSIKAKILASMKKDFTFELDCCEINLKECFYSDKMMNLKLFEQEVYSSAGLSFYMENKASNIKLIMEDK
ncbi:MAG: helix-turn-helix transcriptional regulator [Candidatus Sericytochromatia bacterium]